MEKRGFKKYQSLTYQKLLQQEKEYPKEKEDNLKLLEKLRKEASEIGHQIFVIRNDRAQAVMAVLGKEPGNIPKIFETITFFGGAAAAFFIVKAVPAPFEVKLILFFFCFALAFGIVDTLFFAAARKQNKKSKEKYKSRYSELLEEEKKKNIAKETKLINQETPIKKEIEKLERRNRHIKRLFEELPNLKRRANERERTAKIAAYDERARTGSQTVKEDLLKSIKKGKWICPYCHVDKDSESSEADHIHPIKKGGLSTLQNMVLICKKCNSNKKDLTLRVFCRKMKCDFEEVCTRLEKLGKDI